MDGGLKCPFKNRIRVISSIRQIMTADTHSITACAGVQSCTFCLHHSDRPPMLIHGPMGLGMGPCCVAYLLVATFGPRCMGPIT